MRKCNAPTSAFIEKVLQPVAFLNEEECDATASNLTQLTTARRNSGQSTVELALSMDEATLAMLAYLQGISDTETKDALGAISCIDNVYARNAKAREIMLWAANPAISDEELCKLVGWKYVDQAREYRSSLGLSQRDASKKPEGFELYAFFSDADPSMEELQMLTGRSLEELETFKQYENVLRHNKAFDPSGEQLLEMMFNHCDFSDDFISRHAAACIRHFVEEYCDNTGLRKTAAISRIKNIMSISPAMIKDICSDDDSWLVRSYYRPESGYWESFAPDVFDPSLAEKHTDFYELCCQRLTEEGYEAENWIQFCQALEKYFNEL